jgi:hypothetical protein
LPGFHAAEYPEDTLSTPAERSKMKLVIEVRDTQLRFLPLAFVIDEKFPLEYGGLYRNRIFEELYPADPPGSGTLIHLFSAPTRPLVPGLAAVRCCLKEVSTGTAAAHACIEVRIQGKKWFGVADSEGNAAVYFPFPTVDNSFSGSSPVPPVNIQKWPLSVRIGYSPDSLTVITPVERGVAEAPPPDLGSILRQQSALIRPFDPELPAGADSVPELTGEITFGQELILRTDTKSELLLEIVPTSP